MSVKDFGAVGDGVTDDTDAINKAIASGAKTIKFTPGTYLITSTLIQGESQTWLGDGGQRATTLKKGFNGDLITMGSLSELNNLNFDGVGATFSGNNIVIPVGCFSPRIVRCRSVDSRERGLYFEANAGGGTVVDGFECSSYDVNVSAAIGGAGDSSATPRFFNNVWLAGHNMAISGWNDTFITNTYLKKILFSNSTANYYISNVRFASSGEAITIQGAGGLFNNCAFAGAVTINNAIGLKFKNCDFGFGVTEDPISCSYNEITHQLYSYNPTWTQGSGTQPSIGNGSITGYYTREGNICTVSIRIVFGSTTSYGNSSTGYLFSLPYKGHQAVNQRGLFATIYASSTGLDYSVKATIPANEASFTLGMNGAGVREGFPATWAAGDTFDIQFSYVVR